MDTSDARVGRSATDADTSADEKVMEQTARVSTVVPAGETSRLEAESLTASQAIGDEPTRVASSTLLESLRAASRESEKPKTRDRAQTLGDDDDTLVFETPRPSLPPTKAAWPRLVAPLRGAALGSLLALPATQDARPASDEANHVTLITPEAAETKASTAVNATLSQKLTATLAPPPEATVVIEAAHPAQEFGPAGASFYALDEGGVFVTEQKWARALSRGEDLLLEGDYDAAAASFERAIEYNPLDARAYRGLGDAHLARARSKEAVQAFQRAITCAPSDAGLRVQMGKAYEASGNPRKAAKSYRRALKLDPELAAAKEAIERLQPPPSL